MLKPGTARLNLAALFLAVSVLVYRGFAKGVELMGSKHVVLDLGVPSSSVL